MRNTYSKVVLKLKSHCELDIGYQSKADVIDGNLFLFSFILLDFILVLRLAHFILVMIIMHLNI